MTAPLGLVERLSNGGQTDLADMAQVMQDALQTIANTKMADVNLYALGWVGSHVVIARAALAKAGGKA
jgi:hypothetical protein